MATFTTETINRHWKVVEVARKQKGLVEWKILNKISTGATHNDGLIAKFITKACVYEIVFTSAIVEPVGSVRDIGSGLEMVLASFSVDGGVNEGDKLRVKGNVEGVNFTKNITFPRTMNGSKVAEYCVQRMNTVPGLLASAIDPGTNNVTIYMQPENVAEVITLTSTLVTPITPIIPPNP